MKKTSGQNSRATVPLIMKIPLRNLFVGAKYRWFRGSFRLIYLSYLLLIRMNENSTTPHFRVQNMKSLQTFRLPMLQGFIFY